MTRRLIESDVWKVSAVNKTTRLVNDDQSCRPRSWRFEKNAPFHFFRGKSLSIGWSLNQDDDERNAIIFHQSKTDFVMRGLQYEKTYLVKPSTYSGSDKLCVHINVPFDAKKTCCVKRFALKQGHLGGSHTGSYLSIVFQFFLISGIRSRKFIQFFFVGTIAACRSLSTDTLDRFESFSNLLDA